MIDDKHSPIVIISAFAQNDVNLLLLMTNVVPHQQKHHVYSNGCPFKVLIFF